MGAPPAMRTSCMCGMKRSEFRPEESERRASRSLCQSPPEQTADAVASALAQATASLTRQRRIQTSVPSEKGYASQAFPAMTCWPR